MLLELVLEGLIRAGVTAAELAAAAKNIERKIRTERKSTSGSFDPKDVFGRFDEYYEKFKQEQAQKERQNQQRSYTSGSTSTAEQQYYAALEVPVGSEFAVIKAAYKRMAKKYHPDRFADDAQKTATAQKVMQKINEAYTYFEKKHQQ